MNVILKREIFTDSCTIGSLFIDDKFECFTLEDKDRNLESGGLKIKGETAITRGSYSLIMDYSNRFKKDLPHVLNVPQFEGIRIHAGNTSKDTEGCILLGTVRNKDSISNSQIAVNSFISKLKSCLDNNQQATITIL